MAIRCPFCEIVAKHSREIRVETRRFVAFTPLWPVNTGHTLLVPKRHIIDPFALNRYEMRDLRLILHKAKHLLDERLHPDGYNIGVNVGPAAGQTVFHLHIHLIPRFLGDVPDSRGGIIRQLLQDYKTTPRPPWLPEFPEPNGSR